MAAEVRNTIQYNKNANAKTNIQTHNIKTKNEQKLNKIKKQTFDLLWICRTACCTARYATNTQQVEASGVRTHRWSRCIA